VIVVVGRPVLYTAAAAAGAPGLAGRTARVARLAAARGAQVELVGSVGDDPEGDLAIVELGRAGIGHAAVLRDPAARTPVEEVGRTRERGRLPRLDAADVELGLRYVPDCRVLVVAEPLPPEASAAAAAAADYHGAALVVVVPAPPGPLVEERQADRGSEGGSDRLDTTAAGRDGVWPHSATLLQAPPDEDAGDDEQVQSDAFETLVAAFAVRLERGEKPSEAFSGALQDAAWEPAVDD
jgi:hypothetical protein